MRPVVDLSAYFAQVTALVAVRETIYILGSNTSAVNLPFYASIVAISTLDNELHIVTQSRDEERRQFSSPKFNILPSSLHFLLYADWLKLLTYFGRIATQRRRSTCRYKRLLRERSMFFDQSSVECVFSNGYTCRFNGSLVICGLVCDISRGISCFWGYSSQRADVEQSRLSRSLRLKVLVHCSALAYANVLASTVLFYPRAEVACRTVFGLSLAKSLLLQTF